MLSSKNPRSAGYVHSMVYLRSAGDLGMLPLLLMFVFIAEVVAVDGHQPVYGFFQSSLVASLSMASKIGRFDSSVCFMISQ